MEPSSHWKRDSFEKYCKNKMSFLFFFPQVHIYVLFTFQQLVGPKIQMAEGLASAYTLSFYDSLPFCKERTDISYLMFEWISCVEGK